MLEGLWVGGDGDGDNQRPVVYFSNGISTTKRGMVACVRAVEAATEAVLATADIVAMCPLTVHEPHAVHTLTGKNAHR